MRASEIIGALQKLASNISTADDVAVNAYPADTNKRFVPVVVNPAAEPDQGEQQPPLDTMVPPLQQKMELLKRAVDIDNVFDGTSVDKTADDGADYKQEISSITRNAGIPTAAIMALTDEEPLDD